MLSNQGLSKSVNEPIVLLLVYLFASLVIFGVTFGQETPNALLVFLYCTICYLGLMIGYLPKWKRKKESKPFFYNEKIAFIIAFCAMTTIVSSLYTIQTFYPDFATIKRFFFQPGQAYEYVKAINRSGTLVSTSAVNSFIGIAINCLMFTKYILFSFTFLYWGSLKGALRSLSICAIFIYVLQTFLVGAMVNIGLAFFALLPVLQFKRSKGQKNRRKTTILVVSFAILMFLLIAYFLGTRAFFTIEGVAETSVLMSGILGLMYYVSHGYVGLAECLALPFQFTYGHTFFRGIATTVLPYLDIPNQFVESYLMRNQIFTGRSATQVWSTAFPWIASDTSFLLIPFILFLLGMTLKKIWLESLYLENPFALLLMGQIYIFCFMIPANNQLFHTFGNSVGFIAIASGYLLFNYKDNLFYSSKTNIKL